MNILFYLMPKNKVDFLYSDFTIRQTLEKMKGKRYSMLPIIDRESGKYVRSIMEGDILYYLTVNRLSFEELEKRNLSDIPSSRVIKAVGVTCQVQALYDTIYEQNFVPVIDDEGIFIGIVTRRQVMIDLIQAKTEAK
jgi:predicted transcriptional regulator